MNKTTNNTYPYIEYCDTSCYPSDIYLLIPNMSIFEDERIVIINSTLLRCIR